MKTSFTAKKDFVVVKNLIYNTNRWETPVMRIAIQQNEIIKPTDLFFESVKSEYETELAYVGKGAIHAYTYTNTPQNECYPILEFKAIVRKGTKFYVNTSGTEIAAEELYITDEEPTKEEIAETQEYIAKELIAAAEQHNGIRVGDILLSDKSFVHVEGYKDDGSMTAIGVVGYFIGENPISVALKNKKMIWSSISEKNVIPIIWSEYKRYSGRRDTNFLLTDNKDKLDGMPALKYCVEYKTKGTKKGDWYFPSSGEVANIARNIAIINFSIGKIKKSIKINNNNYMWSSTKYDEKAWHVYLKDCNLYRAYKNLEYEVRPVLDIR